MKMTYLFIAIVTLSALACGVMSPTVAQMPLTQTAVFTPTAQSVNTELHIYTTPDMLVVLGDPSVTWNIRTGPSLDYPIVGIAHGGMVFEKLSSDGGWIQVPEGWICGQAFGLAERCE